MKKKLLLALLVVMSLVCLFAISVCAESVHEGKVDLAATVTLSDGTVLDLFDAEGNALIWYVDANSATGYSSVRADSGAGEEGYTGGSVVINQSYEFNVGNTTVGSKSAYECNSLTITVNGSTVSNGNIVVANFMDDDVKTDKGNDFTCIKSIFKNNTNLQYAYLNLTTVAIQQEAFYGCTALKFVNLASLTELRQIAGSGAFNGCTSLFAGETLDLTGTKLVIFGNNSSSSGGDFCNVPFIGVNLPNTVTDIGHYVFQKSGLQSFHFPSSVKTIHGSSTFRECTALKTVTGLEDTAVTTLVSTMFYKCSSLESIKLPKGLVKINGATANNDDGTFEACTSLKSISFPATVTHVYGNTFTDCSALSTVIFEPRDGVTPINFYGWGPFLKCTSLKEIVLPEGMTELPNCFLNQCYALEKVTLPSTLTTFKGGEHFYQAGKNAASGKFEIFGLENTSVKEIPYACFRQSKLTLTELRLPNTVETISQYAFADCSIEYFYLGASVKTIGSESLAYNTTALKAMYIPSTVESINSNSLKNNNGSALYIIVGVDDPSSTVIDTIETAVQSGKDESAYIKYADYVANPSSYSGKNIVYGGNKCAIFYNNVHTTTAIEGSTCQGECSRCGMIAELENAVHIDQMVINGGETVKYMQAFTVETKCSSCGRVATSETIAAIITTKGYSSDETGNTGIHQEFKVDKKALGRYAEILEVETTTFGILAGVAGEEDGNPIVADENGKLSTVGNSTIAQFGLDSEYSIIKIKLTGINTNASIYCGAYIALGQNITYISDVTEDNKASKYEFTVA